MHGEDLPAGALARETAEVPYQLPAVARDATECPMCEKVHHSPLPDETHGSTSW